jgi:hypothetical protein
MSTRQTLLFTLTFLAAALTAAAVVLLLRRPRQEPIPIDVTPPPMVGPEPASASSAEPTSANSAETWAGQAPTPDGSDEHGDTWWGVR